MNTSVAVDMITELNNAVNKTFPLYGNDIRVYSAVLNQIVEHEKQKTGLDLSHRQDKDFIKVSVMKYFIKYFLKQCWNAYSIIVK